jgi:lysophospholipase L1-like esterase
MQEAYFCGLPAASGLGTLGTMNPTSARMLLTCAALNVAILSTALAQNGPAGRPGFGRGQMSPPGPPAPVPPEVAIARPTTDELAHMNDDLKQFIATSSDKDLLEKWQSLITVQMPRDNPCIRPVGSAQNPRHLRFLNIATNEDFDVLFLGDSITDLINVDDDGNGNPGGKAPFAKYFDGVKIANFGISGDTTQGVLWRLQNGEGKGHKPKAVMLMIGTNNTGNSSGAEIAEGIGAIVLELRNDFPDAKIMLMAIFPRGSGPGDANRRKCEAANKIIAKLDDGKHVFFTDINSKFLDAQGGLVGFRTTDHLHPVTQGFDIWASSVAPTLKSWIN